MVRVRRNDPLSLNAFCRKSSAVLTRLPIAGSFPWAHWRRSWVGSFGARPARRSAPGCGCGHPHDSRTPTPTTKTYRWGPRASHPNDEDLSLGTPDWSPALRFVLVTKGRAGNRVRLPRTLRLQTAKTFIFSKGHSGATLRSQLSFGFCSKDAVLVDR